MRSWISSLLCLTLVYAVGFVGHLGALQGLRTWYPVLELPAWAPSPGVFGLLWTVLSLPTALALAHLWDAPKAAARTWALGLFGLYLTLHALWPWLLLAWQKPRPALFESFAMFGVILALLVCGFAAKRSAGWLLLPALAWSVFAALLSAQIVRALSL